MVNLLQQNARDGASPLRALLSVTVLLLAGSMSHASEPVAAGPVAEEPVPPSPMAETPASVRTSVSPVEKHWQERPLGSVKATIKPTAGELPSNFAAPRLAEGGVFQQSFGDSRPWMLSSYEWEAPVVRHLPLFFEEPNLERLGYTHRCYLDFCGYGTGPRTAECLQPVVSGLHFFGRIPFVPYMWGYQSGCEPVYTLGVDRPGSPVCHRKYQVPLSLRGALYEAGFITGLVYVIP